MYEPGPNIVGCIIARQQHTARRAYLGAVHSLIGKSPANHHQSLSSVSTACAFACVSLVALSLLSRATQVDGGQLFARTLPTGRGRRAYFYILEASRSKALSLLLASGLAFRYGHFDGKIDRTHFFLLFFRDDPSIDPSSWPPMILDASRSRRLIVRLLFVRSFLPLLFLRLGSILCRVTRTRTERLRRFP